MRFRHWPFSIMVATVIAFAAILAASDAEAQNIKKGVAPGSDMITAANFDGIMASLTKNGFSGQLTTDSDGDPLITSTDPNEPFSIQFYGCTGGMDCEYIQFVEGWHLPGGTTPDVIEKWNADKVWGTAYLDSENDPWLDLPINLKGGVTVENFGDTVSWWSSITRDFETQIGFNK